MKITEKELEDFIFEKLNKGKNEELYKLGLCCFVHDNNFVNNEFSYYKQVSLGDYGRCDILAFSLNRTDEFDDSKYDFTYRLIELKEGEINKDIIFQCLKYKSAINKSVVDLYPDNVYSQIVIIGKTISKEVFDLIKLTLGDDSSVYIYDVSLDNGISFSYVNDSTFFEKKCCESPGDYTGSCNGSCFVDLSTGVSLSSKIKDTKLISGIK